MNENVQESMQEMLLFMLTCPWQGKEQAKVLLDSLFKPWLNTVVHVHVEPNLLWLDHLGNDLLNVDQ